jgi:hypothetical protein
LFEGVVVTAMLLFALGVSPDPNPRILENFDFLEGVGVAEPQ